MSGAKGGTAGPDPLARLEQFRGPFEWLFVVSAGFWPVRGTHRLSDFLPNRRNAMRKFIGRSVAAAAIAAATVVPLAGIASAAPQADHGRNHHRQNCHHRGFDRGFDGGRRGGFGRGGFGNFGGFGRGGFGFGGLFGFPFGFGLLGIL
ncbi:hypothetical protein [Streptomyces kronopolitis]